MTSLASRAREFNLAGTAFYRSLGLLAGLAANLSIIAILTREFGTDSYAAYALVASLINLLPFADLGLGASVINSTSDSESKSISPAAYVRHLSRTRDILVCVAVALLAVDLALYLTGSWVRVLGALGSSSGIAPGATFTFACVAVAIPLGMGSRILQGRSRMIDVVRIGLVGPAISLIAAAALFLANATPEFYLFIPGAAYLAIAIISFTVGLKRSEVKLLPAFTQLQSRKLGDVRIAETAVPFLIISLGMAFGFQSHRLLLAHFGTIDQVAQYSIVAQFTGPVLAVISVVGQNLWNRYRSGLSTSTLTPGSFKSHVLIFGGIGIVSAVGIAVLVPFASTLVSDGEVSPPVLLCAAAGLYVFATSVHQPSAMLLNDVRGLWAQAGFVLAVAAATIISIVLSTKYLGAASTYLGTGVAMLVLQVVPSMRLAFARIRRQVPVVPAGLRVTAEDDPK